MAAVKNGVFRGLTLFLGALNTMGKYPYIQRTLSQTEISHHVALLNVISFPDRLWASYRSPYTASSGGSKMPEVTSAPCESLIKVIGMVQQ